MLAVFGLAAAAAVPVVLLTIAAVLTPDRTDLKCFWTGARFVLGGADPYDPAAWSSAMRGQFTNMLGRQGESPCPGRYGYPLTTALLTLPLGALPLDVAAVLWGALLLGGIAAGIAMVARAGRLAHVQGFALAAIVLASQPAWWNSIFLQFGGVVLLGVGLAALPRTALVPARSVLAVTLLAMKPHVAPLVVLERATSATPRSRLAAGAVLTALVLTSLAVLPSWPVEWVSELALRRTEMALQTASLWAIANATTGRAELATALVTLALAGFLLAVRRSGPRDALERVAVALVAWMLVVPYLSGGDLVALAVAWCAVVRRGFVVPAVLAADIGPWIAYWIDPVFGSGVAIPLTAVTLAVALRRQSSATIGARAG